MRQQQPTAKHQKRKKEKERKKGKEIPFLYLFPFGVEREKKGKDCVDSDDDVNTFAARI